MKHVESTTTQHSEGLKSTRNFRAGTLFICPLVA